MKKILIFIAMVAMIASVVSAQMSVSISGAVKTEIGIDLDQMDTGIQVAGDGVQIKVTPALDADGKTMAGADDGDTMYGEIGISGIAVKIDTGWNGAYGSYSDLKAASSGDDQWELAWGKMYAKLVLGNLEILLKEDNGTSINYQGQGAWNWYIKNAYQYEIFDGAYGGSDNDTSLAVYNSDNWDHPFFDPHGISDSIDVDDVIAAKLSIPDVMNIQLDVGSRDSWASATYVNDYAFRAGVNLTAVENLTLAAGMNMAAGYYYNQYIAAGAKVAYKIMIGEEDSIEPIVALTYTTESETQTGYESEAVGDGAMGVSGGLTANVAGIKATAFVGYQIPDLSGSDSNQLAFTVALDMGLVENLTLQAAFANETITTAGTVSGGVNEMHAKIAYAIAAGDITITPAVQVSYDDRDISVGAIDDEALYAKVEITVAGLLDNTTFSLRWDSNDLMDNETAVPGDGDVLGQVVFKTKISF